VLLSDLRDEWNAHQTSVSRTVAHLFSVRPSGGAGRAYLDVLCHNDLYPGGSYDYGVSTLSATGASYEKILTAHELGHNFSSHHTHCYEPEIDQCYNGEAGCYDGTEVQIVGTIMSYCNQRIPEFHSRVETERIRPAAEAAYPTCIDTAGLPAEVREEDGSALLLTIPTVCPVAELQNDDGFTDYYYGGADTAQLAWIKRFTPTCYPFLLERIDLLIGHAASVAPGRALRLLVYADPNGAGDPSGAVLAYTGDTTVQVVSNSVFNEYVLEEPVGISSGDLYIGAYDLVADPSNTYIGSVDTSVSGDSFRAFNSHAPEDFTGLDDATWIIRGWGGPVGAGSVALDWGAPCNDVEVPGQDYAVYVGELDDFTDYWFLTCSTGRESSYLAVDAPDNSFFLVVPGTSTNEGSYGRTGAGAERAPATVPCRIQEIGACP
jgi:hypothetical protein